MLFMHLIFDSVNAVTLLYSSVFHVLFCHLPLDEGRKANIITIIQQNDSI